MAWPHQTHRLPAEDFYSDLIAAVSVGEETDRRIRGWLDTAIEHVVETLRPQLLDVDGVLCGSFATGTHVRGTRWDVDVAVRVHTPHDDWREPGHALAELRRWLQEGLGPNVAVAVVGGSVILADDETVALRIMPCWRSENGAWASVSSLPAPRRPAHHPDPVGHRDLVISRDRSLGGSIFRNLIRIVKHLNAEWGRRHGYMPLRSFDIEACALDYCTRPFSLAETIPGFLSTVADAYRALRRSVKDGGQRRRPESDRARDLLCEAAEQAERALMTSDHATAYEILIGLFGDVHVRGACERSGDPQADIRVQLQVG